MDAFHLEDLVGEGIVYTVPTKKIKKEKKSKTKHK